MPHIIDVTMGEQELVWYVLKFVNDMDAIVVTISHTHERGGERYVSETPN